MRFVSLTILCLFCVAAMASLTPAVAQETPTESTPQETAAQPETPAVPEAATPTFAEQNPQSSGKLEDQVPESTAGFLKGTEISGYVSASYFYNFNKPESGENTGRGFDVRHNEFMFNKFVLHLEHPVEYNPYHWTAGYKATLLFGQDAGFTQAAGLSLGEHGDLFDGNVTINIPVGYGLKVAFGKCGTTIGYESSYTEELSNWSGGNQWTFVEPFTHTGLMIGYKFSDKVEAIFHVNNGWDLVRDNNRGKSFMSTINITPNDNNSAAFTVYGGPEQADTTANWRRGFDCWLDHTFNGKVHAAVEFDYGSEPGAAFDGSTAKWTAVGGWFFYTPSEKWNFAVRGDWLKDEGGARTSEVPFLAPFPANEGQKITSLTFTLNLKPVESMRIAPELRWDHSSLSDVFAGKSNQVTFGVGAAYFF